MLPLAAMIALLAGYVAAALLLHELGHLAAARALGYPARITVAYHGPCTWGVATAWNHPRLPLPCAHHRFTVALAGPWASMLLAAMCAALGGPRLLVAVSLYVGATNLLPLPGSDLRSAVGAWRDMRALRAQRA